MNENINSDDRILAGFSCLFGIVGLVIYFVKRDCSRFLKLYCVQGICWWGIAGILSFVSKIFRHIPLINLLNIPIGILSLLVAVFGLIGAYKAFTGRYYKIPIIGDVAERFFNI